MIKLHRVLIVLKIDCSDLIDKCNMFMVMTLQLSSLHRTGFVYVVNVDNKLFLFLRFYFKK